MLEVIFHIQKCLIGLDEFKNEYYNVIGKSSG